MKMGQGAQELRNRAYLRHTARMDNRNLNSKQCSNQGVVCACGSRLFLQFRYPLRGLFSGAFGV